MGFHHVAMAIHDVQANYDFYTQVMGFELVKTVTAPTPEGGFSKHFFYSTGKNEAGEQGVIGQVGDLGLGFGGDDRGDRGGLGAQGRGPGDQTAEKDAEA